MDVHLPGAMLRFINTIDDMINQFAIFADKTQRVARAIVMEGTLDVVPEYEIWPEITYVRSIHMIHMLLDVYTDFRLLRRYLWQL